MNWKTVLSLAVAVAMGLGAMWVGRNMMNQGQLTGAAPAASTEGIVVAARDLEPGEVIADKDLTTKDWPAGSMTNFFKAADKKSLVGRVIVASVMKEYPISDRSLAPPGSEGGVSGLVPPGMRAVSVETGENSGVSAMLTPNCRVDVIGTLRPNRGEMAKTIVENARVIAVGNHVGHAPNDPSGNMAAPPRNVWLVVSPRDAETIELAQSMGKLRLVLRAAGDSTSIAGGGVTASQLTGIPEAEPNKVNAAPGATDKILAFLKEMQERQAKNPQPVRTGPQNNQETRGLQIIRGGSESSAYEWVKDKNGQWVPKDSPAAAHGNAQPPPSSPPTTSPSSNQDPFESEHGK